MVGLRLAIKRDVFSLTTIDLKQMLAASPRIWKFIFTSYLEGTVRMIREFDIFIVNYFTNTASTGLYKIAREMARAATRLTGPFHQAIYPNLAKMKVSENFLSFRKLVIQSSVTLGTMVFVGFLVFLMLGEYLLIGIFGESYSAAYRPAIFCIFGIVIWGYSSTLSPAMMAMGQVQSILKIQIFSSCIYILTLAALTNAHGISGAAVAFIALHLTWGSCMLLNFGKTLNRANKRV